MLYELMVVSKPLLPDDVRKSLHNEVLNITEKLGGEVKDTDVWGKRYLAYEINGHKEGYHILYLLELDSSEIKEFTRLLNLKQELLRYMFVKIEDEAQIKERIKKKEMDIRE